MSHLSRCRYFSGWVNSKAADVVGVVKVETLPVVGGVVAHTRSARWVDHLRMISGKALGWSRLFSPIATSHAIMAYHTHRYVRVDAYTALKKITRNRCRHTTAFLR